MWHMQCAPFLSFHNILSTSCMFRHTFCLVCSVCFYIFFLFLVCLIHYISFRFFIAGCHSKSVTAHIYKNECIGTRSIFLFHIKKFCEWSNDHQKILILRFYYVCLPTLFDVLHLSRSYEQTNRKEKKTRKMADGRWHLWYKYYLNIE